MRADRLQTLFWQEEGNINHTIGIAVAVCDERRAMTVALVTQCKIKKCRRVVSVVEISAGI